MPLLTVPQTGDVWDVNLSPTYGAEQSGIRPVLVISSAGFSASENQLAVVVPITGTDRGIPAHHKIRGCEAGLSKHSVVMCDQVRTISHLRFLQERDEASSATLLAVRLGDQVSRA